MSCGHVGGVIGVGYRFWRWRLCVMRLYIRFGIPLILKARISIIGVLLRCFIWKNILSDGE